MENSSRLDKFFVAGSRFVLELAANDIVGLVSLQAECFAEFLDNQKNRRIRENVGSEVDLLAG